MLNLNLTAEIDKKLKPFLKEGSKIRLVIDPFANPKTAQVQLDLKDGLSSDILEVLGLVGTTLNFESVSESSQDKEFNEIEEPIRRVDLPRVQNDYEEVKGMIDFTFDNPVQSLSISKKQNPPIKQASMKPKPDFVVQDPEPLPVSRESSPEVSQIQLMMNQMQNMMQEMQKIKSGKVQEDNETVQPEVEENQDSIMSAQEFYDCLKQAGDDLPNIDFNKKLSKEEALELDKYKIKKPAYVVSSVGQLFVDDVGISVRQSVACNLSSLPIFKLKKSADLIRSFKNGWLKFVDYKTAKRLAEKADLTASTEGVDSKLKTFIGEDASGHALTNPIDVTPGVSDESSSEKVMSRIASRNSKESDSDVFIVGDIDESIQDEQSDLLHLTGDGDEPASEALLASRARQNIVASKTWKPTTRLD